MLLPFESVPEKKRKWFLLAEIRFLKNFGLLLTAIMFSKKNENERISFPLENPLPLAVIKDTFKIYFQEMEKLLPMGVIFKILAQNNFH